MKPIPLALSLALLLPAAAQELFIIRTVAGVGRPTVPSAGLVSTAMPLFAPSGLAADQRGNVYIADEMLHQVFRIAADGTLTVVAGTGSPGFGGDGGTATQARLNGPAGLAVDTSGSLFIADSANHRIRRVSADGMMSTVTGTGLPGRGPERTFAVTGQLDTPRAVVVTAAGDIVIADTGNNRVRLLSGGIITTVAGSATAGVPFTNGMAAVVASLLRPVGLAAASDGSVYVAEAGGHVVRRINLTGGLEIVAGTFEAGYAGEFVPGTAAKVNAPAGVVIDGQGVIFIADTANHRIRQIGANGSVTTAVGTGVSGLAGDGGPALTTELSFPAALAADRSGNFFVIDSGSKRVRRFRIGGTISTIAGSPAGAAWGDGGPPTAAALIFPSGLAIDGGSNLYIAEAGSHRVRRVTPRRVIEPFAGSGLLGSSPDERSAQTAHLEGPTGVSAGLSGDVYVSDTNNHRVRRVSGAGTIFAAVGTGVRGFAGDFSGAQSARLDFPRQLARDSAGNLYIADSNNHRVRRVSPEGLITTVAGSGVAGYSGDGSQARDARLNSPTAVAVDLQGNVYIADTGNHCVRRVNADGVTLITTVVGTGVAGFSGDGGAARQAQLNSPRGLALDGAGNLYIADSGNHRVRRVSTTNVITTAAGSGTEGFSGDGDLATVAELAWPEGLASDGVGTIYIADKLNHRVRALSAAQIFAAGFVNSASFAPGPVAPGEIVTIFGDIGPTQARELQLDGNGLVSTLLGDTRVFFDNVPAPVIYAAKGQVSVVVPYSVAGKQTVQAQVLSRGIVSNAITLQVTAASPALFTAGGGRGQGAILNQDNSVNSVSNPAERGSVVSLYATGEGATSPGGIDGKLADGAPPRPVLPVTVEIGGVAAEVEYAGGAPGFVAGVMQVNARVPEGIASGSVSVVLKVGGAASPEGVTVAVR